MKRLCVGCAVVLLSATFVSAEHSIVSVLPEAHVLPGDGAAELSLQTTEPTKARAFFYSADSELLGQDASLEYARNHIFSWDRRNADGSEVRGLFTYRVKTEDQDGYMTAYDPLIFTGARDASIYWPKWDKEKQRISFQLQRDSLARVRVGIKDGPMIATPADWVPVFRNAPYVSWDGWDSDHTQDYSDDPALQFHLEAISLPDNYLFTPPSEDQGPVSYINAQWIKNVLAVKAEAEPNEYRIAKSVVGLPEESSAISLEFDKELEEDGYLRLDRAVTVTVKVPEIADEDKANQAYEVVYFIDRYMVYEEPLMTGSETYELDPAKLEKGGHTFIANVILGSARVGTASLRVVVP
ncbi:MAG: hypothetical protein KJ626_02805 [Verrucomicrobia bacterium]|nr:hypothetical protein [Verrucomicrobiota bacterium]